MRSGMCRDWLAEGEASNGDRKASNQRYFDMATIRNHRGRMRGLFSLVLIRNRSAAIVTVAVIWAITAEVSSVAADDSADGPEQRLAEYRQELGRFRREFGGTRALPEVPFFLFGIPVFRLGLRSFSRAQADSHQGSGLPVDVAALPVRASHRSRACSTVISGNRPSLARVGLPFSRPYR